MTSNHNGISIYPGLDNTPTENLELLERAAACGIRRVFTSLHIPETDTRALKCELTALLQAARAHDMEVISDVSPATLALLDLKEFNPAAFRMLGISTIRLDYGFGLEEIARLTHNRSGLNIELNASTITVKLITALIELGANLGRIDALHNFYPRPGTGISEELLVRKNMLLHKYRIKVGAFVPSMARPRSPIGAGLPTLEDHRGETVDLACRHLVALGCDSVFIGDSMPTDAELTALGTLPGGEVRLRARLLTKNKLQQQLLESTFTSRLDEARDAIRADSSRAMVKKENATIAPENTIVRPIGAVTLDNSAAGRYMGELQILKHPRPADPRVNVVAMVDEAEVNLLHYISPGRKFSFILHP